MLVGLGDRQVCGGELLSCRGQGVLADPWGNGRSVVGAVQFSSRLVGGVKIAQLGWAGEGVVQPHGFRVAEFSQPQGCGVNTCKC